MWLWLSLWNLLQSMALQKQCAEEYQHDTVQYVVQVPSLKYQLPTEPNVYVDLVDDTDTELMFDEWLDFSRSQNKSSTAKLHLFVDWLRNAPRTGDSATSLGVAAPESDSRMFICTSLFYQFNKWKNKKKGSKLFQYKNNFPCGSPHTRNLTMIVAGRSKELHIVPSSRFSSLHASSCLQLHSAVKIWLGVGVWKIALRYYLVLAITTSFPARAWLTLILALVLSV